MYSAYQSQIPMIFQVSNDIIIPHNLLKNVEDKEKFDSSSC